MAAVCRPLTVPIDVEGGGELFGSDPGEATLLRGLLSDSLGGLGLPTSVAHPEADRWKHCG